MRRALRLLALGLALSAGAAHAQAPRITPAGDPSVRSDTIYRLAVDPADHPEESFVFLLDDGVEIWEADGRGTRTFRYVAQVLTDEAVEAWGERTLSWDGTRQRLTLNWARVLDLRGNVVSERPEHDQESLAPVSLSAPVYTDQKLRRLSLGGVAPGTIVDISYTIEQLEPVIPGDFLKSWSVHTAATTLRSRYVVELPAGLAPVIREENLNFRRRETVRNGRRVMEWSTRDVPRIEGEPFMADSNDVFMSIRMSGPVTWQTIAQWYHGLSKDRYVLTPAIEARLAEVLKDARTRADSLRAVHRWVAQDFRYVSLSLGLGGYQPRTPASVFETMYGDCKDKATLFIALARRMGIEAHPVLLSSVGGVAPDMPSIYQFDHMIAAVREGDGYTYLDLTADLIPYGEISPGYQGEFGLIVHPDGRGEEIRFPEDPAPANRSVTRIEGTLAADGTFAGRLEASAAGAMQYDLRGAFARRFTDRERQQLTRAMAGNVFPGAQGDSLEIFDGKDLAALPRMAVHVRGGRAAERSGNTLILTVPLPLYAGDGMVDELRARPEPRRFPIEAASVVGPSETVSEMRVTLPEGYRARLPQDVLAESVFGRYEATYRQEGRELRIVRSMRGAEGWHPASRFAELLAWLEAVSEDDARFVVVEAPAS